MHCFDYSFTTCLLKSLKSQERFHSLVWILNHRFETTQMFLLWIVICTKDAEMDTYISKIKTGDFLFEFKDKIIFCSWCMINVQPENLEGSVIGMKNVTCWSIFYLLFSAKEYRSSKKIAHLNSIKNMWLLQSRNGCKRFFVGFFLRIYKKWYVCSKLQWELTNRNLQNNILWEWCGTVHDMW